MFSPALGPTRPPIPLDKAAGPRSCHYPHPVLWLWMSGATPAPNPTPTTTETALLLPLFMCNALLEQKNRTDNGVKPFQSRVQTSDKPFVPLKLMCKSCQPCPFNKVPHCPQTYSSNSLGSKKKEPRYMPECHQSFTLTPNMSWDFLLCSTPHTQRDCQSATLCSSVCWGCFV
jgi:hypothetical protein